MNGCHCSFKTIILNIEVLQVTYKFAYDSNKRNLQEIYLKEQIDWWLRDS